jgi:hypothetical protein
MQRVKFNFNINKIIYIFSKFIIFKTMQNHAAVFRDGPTLIEGCKKMDEIYDLQKDLKVIICFFKLTISSNILKLLIFL